MCNTNFCGFCCSTTKLKFIEVRFQVVRSLSMNLITYLWNFVICTKSTKNWCPWIKKTHSLCVPHVFWNTIFKKNFTGTTSIKSTILKDGHNFTVHILDPKEGTEETDADEDMPSPANEKAEFEKSEKDGKL